MTPEEKVALLKEAGVWDVIGYPSCIDKLFDLVAKHEREACAKVCDELQNDAVAKYFDATAGECAAAIRARGN